MLWLGASPASYRQFSALRCSKEGWRQRGPTVARPNSVSLCTLRAIFCCAANLEAGSSDCLSKGEVPAALLVLAETQRDG